MRTHVHERLLMTIIFMIHAATGRCVRRPSVLAAPACRLHPKGLRIMIPARAFRRRLEI